MAITGIVRGDTQIEWLGDIDFNSNKLTNIANGTAATDVVTKQQLDSVAGVTKGFVIAMAIALG